MAAEGIVTYIFTGEEETERDELGLRRYIIPLNVTHLLFHESVTAIPAGAFRGHPNIIEVYCHIGVKRIERSAFRDCPRLKRLIIPGVEEVEDQAFCDCEAVTHVECPKLERVGEGAFYGCKSLSNINLPSAKVVGSRAFEECEDLMVANFGKDLESIGEWVFRDCPSLERITIPLKNGLIISIDTLQGCDNLKQVDLVEEAALRDTVDALHFEEWRNDMKGAIDSINHFLPEAGSDVDQYGVDRDGERKLVIRLWIRRVLRKIIDYKAQHRSLLNEAAATLKLVLPNDIVMKNVLLFLELPSHTFDGEDEN